MDLRFVGKSAPPAVPLGVINDDSTSVGSVHFGVVYGIGVSPETTIREKDHMVGDWLPWSQLCEEAASGANYETWSSILLRSLAAEDIRAAHAGRIPIPQIFRDSRPEERGCSLGRLRFVIAA